MKRGRDKIENRARCSGGIAKTIYILFALAIPLAADSAPLITEFYNFS